MTYKLKNDTLTVSFDNFGAEMTSIVDRQGKEYLWCGDKKYWGRHSPVLFPVVGKPKDNKFTYEDKDYKKVLEKARDFCNPLTSRHK